MDITKTYTANEKMCLKHVLQEILNEIESCELVQNAIEFYLQEEENCTSEDLGDYFYDEICDKLMEYCFKKFEDVINNAIGECCYDKG